ELGHGAAAEVVTVGKAPGENHAIRSRQRPVLVPEKAGFLSQHVLHHVVAVVLTVGAGKHHDAEFQAIPPSPFTRPLRTGSPQSRGSPGACRTFPLPSSRAGPFPFWGATAPAPSPHARP